MASQYLKNALSLFAFTLISISSFSQSVGVSGTAIVPDSDALLELRATDKGVLLSRMNSTQRSNYTIAANSGGGLGASEAGMTIFNTSTNLYNYWDGSAWIVIQTVGGTTGAYIDNQNALDQTADYRISGDGTVLGALGVGTQASLGTSRVLIHDASGTAGELQLLVRDNASLPILSVQDIGRVGIGTSAPAASLEIRGTASSAMFSQRITKNSNIASELTGIGFGSQQSSSVVKSGIVHERISANGTGKLHFLNDNSVDANDVATSETRMTIDQNGNVGIGTTSPGTKLHVANTSPSTWEWSNLSSSVSMELGTNAAGNVGSIRMNSYTPGQFVFIRPSNGNYHVDATTGQYYFNWDESVRGGSNGAIHMANEAGGHTVELNTAGNSFLTGGRLGIGTTSPAEELHVIGDIRSSVLAGGGNVQADGSGNLIISNDIPNNDTGYIWNQNASDQGASFRINGWGETYGLKINAPDGEKIQLTSSGATGSKIRHTTGWAIDYHAGPGNSGVTGSHRFYTTAQNIYREND